VVEGIERDQVRPRDRISDEPAGQPPVRVGSPDRRVEIV
jgi:hypothetical protein